MFAVMRRKALRKLETVSHEVVIRGPEGEQVHYDEKGKRVKSKARVEYLGFEKYLHELRVEAGVVDPEVEKLAEDLQKSDSFWGEMPPLEGNEPVLDG